MIYPLVVLLHIIGALALFAGLGVEWAVLSGLRRTTTREQAGEWLRTMRALSRIGPIAMLTLLVTGIYLMATVWKFQVWIAVGLLVLIVIGALGGGVSGRRLRALAQTILADSGPLPSAALKQLRDPVLVASAWMRTALGIGVVSVMSLKPGLGLSLGIVVGAVTLGLAAYLPTWRETRAAAASVAGRTPVEEA